jgi:hypothetical protein
MKWTCRWKNHERQGTVKEPHVQYAALPYRQGADQFEILLVTSLGTKR